MTMRLYPIVKGVAGSTAAAIADPSSAPSHFKAAAPWPSTTDVNSEAPLHDARQAYLRLASTVGHIPLTLLVSLLAVTAIAWAFTLYQPFAMSASMGSAMGEMEGMEDMAMDSMAVGWSFAGLLIFVTVWTIMMVAMMLPAAAPMILIFALAQARRDRHVAVPTWIFVAGYILVWAAGSRCVRTRSGVH